MATTAPKPVVQYVIAGAVAYPVTLQFVNPDDLDENGDPVPYTIASIGDVEVKLRPPNQSAVSITNGTVVGDGSTGEVSCSVDIPRKGTYVIQGRITISDPSGKFPGAELHLEAASSLFES